MRDNAKLLWAVQQELYDWRRCGLNVRRLRMSAGTYEAVRQDMEVPIIDNIGGVPVLLDMGQVEPLRFEV
jgi:hypothetical protein